MVKTEKDESLIDKIKNGNRKAQEILYNKYRKIITKYIVNKYPFNYDTDDDVSDILIKVFESITSFDLNQAQFSTWVFTVANNHMIDKSRTKAYNMISNTNHFSFNDSGMITTNICNTSTVTASYFTPTSYLSADNLLEEKDSLDFIEKKIGIQDFHLLNMKYIEGYAYEEMAVEMRTSSNTMSNKVNYIKGKLKKGK